MTRAATLLSLTTLTVALALGAGGCATARGGAVENSLWKLVTGHPKPIVLRKPEAVSCEPTLGEPDCYPTPATPPPGGG